MDPDQTNKLKFRVPDNAKSDDFAPKSGPIPEVGWRLDKGVTRPNNEDSVAAVTLNQASEAISRTIGIYAVADGMGGQEAGEIASQLAIHTAVGQLMENVALADGNMLANYPQWLENAVALANQVVNKKARADNKDMGTTLVLAVVLGYDVHIANVGDSRAYRISPAGIHQITHDQSLVQSLIDNGAITPDQATNHPQRNILTQAIGLKEDVAVGLFHEMLDDDESLLLCSDGLWGTLTENEIIQIVRDAATPNAACQALVDTCNAQGARDNISVVLVRPGSHVFTG
jgi:protein phosphatase